ncbi:endolytic transglycosylase MltG [Candidatus Saccharibacteria bacterium]|nr:endolytic transglycosylase MltG [Candidatus Saccharibacteria bacterium]
MRILGLDVGEKRIGVAKADSNTRIAVPVGFLLADGSEWQEIARLARLNDTNLFVLGLPRSNEGNATKQTEYVRNFAKTLMAKIPGAKISFQDESLTSVVAEERLKSRKKHYEKGEIDAEAATIILQDFLEHIGARDQYNQNLSASGAVSPQEDTGHDKKKSKRRTRIIATVVILVVIAIVAVGGVIWIKDKRAKERAEYYAELESQMKPEVFNFTILPGETIFSIKKNLADLGYSNDEIDAGFAANYDYDFLRDRPEGASLEGYLYGDTHEFYRDSTVQEILDVFLKEMGKVINENNLVERYATRGLSLFEGITLASIVQKEAPSPEQPTVAQVFLSRLTYGIPLGSDVTVTYALDVLDPNREIYSDNQAALKVDSCYNTRLYGGLPCGPISNPGLSALLAVAEPTDTAYLYFLTGDDGLMYYSHTEAEHVRNIYSHCQVLCNISL